MKSSARRVVGIVMGMLLALVVTTRAQERTAFVCEGRIGNAATAPGQALAGDFEYDISTNTAAPYQTGQFAWPTNMPSGTPVPFEIQYTNGIAYFLLGTNSEGWLSYPVAEDVFTATNSVGTLNVRTRTVQPGSTVRLQDMTLYLAGDPTSYDLGTLVASNNASVTTNYPVAGLPAGFVLHGNAIFTWNVNNRPGRSQSAFQISASEWQADLDADTDRDGTVDNDADETDEDKWTVSRGAFVPVNQWARTAPTNMITEFAPLVIRKLGPLPAGWSVVLQKSNNTDVAIVAATAGDLVGGNVDALETNVSVTALAAGPVTVYAAALKDLGGFANKRDSVAFVRLSLRDENNVERASDTVALQIAPIILAWNSLALERLYCTDLFPVAVATDKQNPPGFVSARTSFDARWMQDFMELGQSMIRQNQALNQVADLMWRGGNGIGSLFIDQFLGPENPPTWHLAIWNNDGNGGNIETFPPYTQQNGTFHPFGRVVLSTQRKNALPRIRAQGLQKPIVLEELNWLYVGHVDEVFSFVSDTEVLVADPELAWREILKMMTDPAVTEKTIRVGNGQYDLAMTTVTDPVNYFVVQAVPAIRPISQFDPMILVTNGTYEVGDELLIDKEVVRVTEIRPDEEGNLPGGRWLVVDRHQYYGTVQTGHAAGALIRRFNPGILANVYPYNSQSNLVARLDKVKNELQTELGKNLTFKSVPVLFRYEGDDDRGRALYTATTANMINSVFDPFPAPGRIFSASPGNQRFEALFQGVVAQTVEFTRNEDDRRAWDNYHVNIGSLHCGSNGKRAMPTNTWWTYTQQFSTWGD